MTWFERIEGEIVAWLTSPEKLRLLSSELRSAVPIVSVGGTTLVSRYDDVREVLSNDQDFGVTELYAERMARTTGPFFLGMEDTPQYRREVSVARRAVRADDADRVSEMVRSYADELLDAARRRGGKLDAVSEYSRLIPLRVVRDYLGVQGPDQDSVKRWMRTLFWDLFLNQENDQAVIDHANQSGAELRPYLRELIAARKAELSAGSAPDDFLVRMLRQQLEDPSIDDDLIRRNVGGVIVGAVDTQSKALAHAMDELFRQPAALASARRAALADDDRLVAAHVWEALRFNPHNSGIFRHSRTDTVIAAGTERAAPVKKGSKILALTISAMFDPDRFPRPDEFLLDRPSDDYLLHFGHGQHLCFGTRLNTIVLPLAAKALLKLPGLRYDPDGPQKIEYEGPFPDRMLLRFDVASAAQGR